MTTTKKQFASAIIVSIVYFSWMYFKIEVRPDHLISYAFFATLYFYNERTRKFFFAMCPFIIYITVYDSMRAFPNYMYNTIHIEDLYLLEKQYFGVFFNGHLVTLNEFFANHQHAVFDVISGVSYITWVPMPLGFAMYLYFTGKKNIYINMAFLFVLTNLIGFLVYYFYPAAPPWYVDVCGFKFYPDTACIAARLGNFDALVGWPLFKTFYSGNANVFAAVPSLHAANPVTCLLASFQLKNRILTAVFLLVTCGMWFGAVYGNHHYLIDVLAGGMTALAAFFVVRVLLRKTEMNKYLLKYEKLI
ncbi:MAG: inositol phosphorylceramide synthase [Candidatus Sabulitectum sp.]|nr:inositol phosphorylceramide synthase [Candidatus Sabulitectum sp.]